MPAVNKTPNLKLNQWQGNEYVKRADFNEDNLNIDYAFGELDGRVGTEKVKSTLSASAWEGNVYSFENDYSSDTYDILIQVADNATLDEIQAFGGAILRHSDSTNIITAMGEVPSVDIPVSLWLYKKKVGA